MKTGRSKTRTLSAFLENVEKCKAERGREQQNATTAPGPKEPTREYVLDYIPRMPHHVPGPWIYVSNRSKFAVLIENPIAPNWWVKEVEGGLLLTPPNNLPVEAEKAQRPIMVDMEYPGTGEEIGKALRLLKELQAARDEMDGVGTLPPTNTAKAKRPMPPKRRKRHNAHQAGDVLHDGSMVVDPTQAILELHDQVNEVTLPKREAKPVPPGKTIEQLLPKRWMPPDGASVTSLTELAKPFGEDRRAREVVKKRFRSLYGKLAKMDAEERAAFLAFATATLQ